LNKKDLDLQFQHWENSFSSKPEMFGLDPSVSAIYAKEKFENQKIKTFFTRKKINILELGAGLGRDTTYFAANSNLIHVTALDYSSEAIKNINKKKKDTILILQWLMIDLLQIKLLQKFGMYVMEFLIRIILLTGVTHTCFIVWP
tara:strand:- start:2268 stop:2702 length:435 start_codon:yes stop_codon:yes gene_type:complete